jgi:site-specific recombinase XerD
MFVRQFCQWMALSDPSFFVPDLLDLPRRPPARQPFIYTVSQIQTLLETASKLTPVGSLRPHTYRCMIGLLYGAGLRISEALALNVGDFDIPGSRIDRRNTGLPDHHGRPVAVTVLHASIAPDGSAQQPRRSLMNPDLLAPYVQGFFQDYLITQRNVSRNTLLSYRDAFRLFLCFTAQRHDNSVDRLLIEDVGPETLLAFLDHLEKERGNTIATRNVRAAALRMFFRYLAGRHPPVAELCRRITAIPSKKCSSIVLDYLEADELQAVLFAVDRSTPRGRRDYTLLWLLYDTGARIQEVLDLTVAALRLVPPEQIRLLGKGRKERLIPLSKEVTALVGAHLKERGIDEQPDARLFVGRHRRPMTRSGVARFVKRYVSHAANTMPTLRGRKITPHTLSARSGSPSGRGAGAPRMQGPKPHARARGAAVLRDRAVGSAQGWGPWG